MDENLINMYIETLNKRLEEFIKNESVLMAKLNLSEQIIKAQDEQYKKANEEKDTFANDSANALLEKEALVQELLQQNDVLQQAAISVTNENDSNKQRYEAQYNVAIRHAEELKNRNISLENECNNYGNKYNEKEKEISILKETHKKEKENLEGRVRFFEEEVQKMTKVEEPKTRKHIKKID